MHIHTKTYLYTHKHAKFVGFFANYLQLLNNLTGENPSAYFPIVKAEITWHANFLEITWLLGEYVNYGLKREMISVIQSLHLIVGGTTTVLLGSPLYNSI